MAAAKVITQEWVAMDEAVRLLGKSQKSVERLAASGELRSTLEPREGRKPQRLYHAGDLERIKVEAIPAPAIEPKPKPAKTMEVAIPTDALSKLENVMTLWLNRPQPIPIREKLWLSLEEAAAYSGLAKGTLQRLRREGHLASMVSGGVKISRASLEGFTNE